MQVQGVVKNIRTEQIAKKNGTGTFTVKHISVEGWSDSNGEINVGFDKVEVGQNVNYVVERKPWGWQPVKNGAAPAAQSNNQAQGSANVSSETYPLPIEHPKNVILNQNALAHATQLALATSQPTIDANGDEVPETDSHLTNRTMLIAYRLAAFSSGRLPVESIISEVNNG